MTSKAKVLDRFGVPNTPEQQMRDKVAVANAYMAWHNCRLCERPTVAGYICFHCKEDDSREWTP